MAMGKRSAAGKAGLAGGSRALARAGPPPSAPKRQNSRPTWRQALPASDNEGEDDDEEDEASGSEPEEATSRRGGRGPAADSDDQDDAMNDDFDGDASDVDDGSDGEEDLNVAQAVADAKLVRQSSRNLRGLSEHCH